MRLPGILVAALLLMAPGAALAVPGIVTTSVSMRAGPGPGFPVVDRLPAGAHVTVHGCIKGGTWCDVSWSGDRGWVSARYLETYYRNRYVYLPDYYDVVDVPIVPFAVSTYWASHYAGRPWYRRHAYWNNYWRSHARFATQVPIGRGGRELERGTRTAITPGAVQQPGVVGGRGVETRTGRFARGNEIGREGFRRDFRESRQPIAGGREGRVEGNRFGGNRIEGRNFEGRRFEGNRFGGNRVEGNRFSGAPAARPAAGPVAQPNVGRPGGFAAQGQMGGPRPMRGGMPQAGGGGAAPHINAAPRVGGAPAAAGGRPGGFAAHGQPLAAQGQMSAPRPMGGGMPHAGGGGGGAAPHINAAPRVGGAPAAVGGRPGGPPGHNR